MPRRVRCSQRGRPILQLGIFLGGSIAQNDYGSDDRRDRARSEMQWSYHIYHCWVPDLSPFWTSFGD